MKIVRRDMNLMKEEVIYKDMEEVVACVMCDYLNSEADFSEYYMVTVDDYEENNF
jgi:hypothetical protein